MWATFNFTLVDRRTNQRIDTTSYTVVSPRFFLTFAFVSLSFTFVSLSFTISSSFSAQNPDHARLHAASTYDSLENLLTAHSTIDAELEKWTTMSVDRGFEESLKKSAEEGDALVKEAKEKKRELKELKDELAKQKRIYLKYSQDIHDDEVKGK